LATRHKISIKLLLGELAALAYIGIIVGIAKWSAISYVLFPELAALAYDIFVRPDGAWAKAPVMLVATPVLAAVAGILIERQFGYGAESVALSIAASLLIIKLLKSPIAPALSAGLLPVVLNEGSLLYPAAILFGTGLLAISSFFYRQQYAKRAATIPASLNADVMELPSAQYAWVPFFLAFLGVAYLLVDLSGWRFIMFPPLVVIAFEMFAHHNVCPWTEKPFRLVIACMLTATAGFAAVAIIGTGPLAAILVVAVSVAVVRAATLHLPPAVAIGLLPFVIPHPDYRFPLAVGAGTLTLLALFMPWRVWARSAGNLRPPL
jgi:hypothetical protein